MQLPSRLVPLLTLVAATSVLLGASPAEVPLGKGTFLVASRELRDPNFVETVVLLIDYSEDGALGVVVNRPSDVQAVEVLPEVEELGTTEEPVYIGGPVSPSQVLVLVRTELAPEESANVFEDVFVTSNTDALRRAAAEETETFRVFAGYSGWAPGQLDAEVAVGGWHILKADAEEVFSAQPDRVWPKMIFLSTAQMAQKAGSRGLFEQPAR